MADEIQPVQVTISPEENLLINSGPAIFTNKMYASMTATGMRITFAEIGHEPGVLAFRGAFFLQYGDAKALRDLLIRQLEQTVEVQNPNPATAS